MSNSRATSWSGVAKVNDATPRPGDTLHADLLGLDDDLRQEIQRLSAINSELLHKSDSTPEVYLAPEGQTSNELDQLRQENSVLRRRLSELESLLTESGQKGGSWVDRQKEYEAILEEKSEVIRTLHLKIQDMQESGGAPSPVGASVQETELLEIKEELDRERQQLQQDEEAMMQQMRTMELAMAKERAELARQRNDLQRLHQEIDHEIEVSARDSGLRERLQSLQRRQHEGAARNVGPGHTHAAAPQLQEGAAPADPKKTSGFFRRLFGGKS